VPTGWPTSARRGRPSVVLKLSTRVIIMQEESADRMADFSTSGKTEATVWAGKARPVLDRSFNSLTDAARVRVSGFNPCLQGE
jgi:hypothetical protein